MGRGQDAHVDAYLALLAHRAHGLLLHDAQQLDLHVQRQVGDLVEKQRAALGDWIRPFLSADRAREAAALVTEQLAFHEFGRNRAAVDRDEGTVARAAPHSWISFATSSLPVPDSPKMCTGAWLRATRAIISRSCCIAGGAARAGADRTRWCRCRRPARRQLDGARHQLAQHAEVQRLGDEIEGAELQRADRGSRRCRAR